MSVAQISMITQLLIRCRQRPVSMSVRRIETKATKAKISPTMPVPRPTDIISATIDPPRVKKPLTMKPSKTPARQSLNERPGGLTLTNNPSESESNNGIESSFRLAGSGEASYVPPPFTLQG